MGARSRIVLAEDHAILREGLRSILSSEPDLEVVHEAADGLDAIRSVGELKPDLLVLDIAMPKMNGIEVLEQLGRSAPATRVMILTVHRTEEYVHAALRAGAAGYVLKDSSSKEFLQAVRSILAGERYICPQVTGQVISGYLGAKDTPPQNSHFEELSAREREVLKLIAEGCRNREVGDLLCISEKTVEKHRANLMRKLGLRNAQTLTAYAIEKGLISR
jgi:DNA-binding NarL/FixJ family response regulator